MKHQNSYVRTQIRIPPELYQQLKQAAQASGRSVNAEMLHRMQLGFGQNASDSENQDSLSVLYQIQDQVSDLIVRSELEKGVIKTDIEGNIKHDVSVGETSALSPDEVEGVMSIIREQFDE